MTSKPIISPIACKIAAAGLTVYFFYVVWFAVARLDHALEIASRV